MRKLYTVLAVAVLATSINAQNVAFFDDFESNSLEGYTLHNLDGLTPDDPDLASLADSAWIILPITFGGWPHGLSAFSVSWYQNDAGPANDWLITPAITVAGDAELTWDAIAITGGNYRDRYQVYVVYSTDIEEIFEDDNTLLVFDTGPLGELNTPQSRSVDLAEFGIVNQTFHLAYRNNTPGFDASLPVGPGNGGNELAIDNIRVTDDGTLSTQDVRIFERATVQPNPASGSYTTVQFNLEAAQEVHLELIDITGKVVSIKNHGILATGNHMLQVDRGNLASGIYLLRLRSGQHSQVLRIAFR